MKERPILFSTPMVKAILDGKKTVTRRIVTEKLVDAYYDYDEYCNSVMPRDIPCTRDYEKQFFMNRCKWSIGDRLWVRETWSHDAPDLETCRRAYEDILPSEGYGPYYKATEKYPGSLIWKPSIHMPRWASRITLEITDLRCERLLEIKENDAIKEGFSPSNGFTARGNFLKLFGELNGTDSITNNVYVWVIEFIKIK